MATKEEIKSLLKTSKMSEIIRKEAPPGANISRVRQEAVDELAEDIYEFFRCEVKAAGDFAKHAKRKSIMKRDVSLVDDKDICPRD